jgi:hypothetical protein
MMGSRNGPATGRWSLDRVLMAAALGLGIAIALAQMLGRTPLAFDAGAYWAAQPGALYQSDWGLSSGRSPFLYSPAFADALIPFRLLPERLFTGLWELGLVAVLVVTIRGWALLALVAAAPFLAFGIGQPLTLIASDIAHGNIHVLLGAVAVFGLRWPALWSIVLLSKVTPGVGLVWFVARREWRNLGIALGVTAAIAAVSFAYRSSDWADWFAFLFASRDHVFPLWTVPIPLPVRLAMSAALVWWGGRTDRPWTVPIAVGWAIPVPYPTMLAAMVCALACVQPAARPDDRSGGHLRSRIRPGTRRRHRPGENTSWPPRTVSR